jgi:predicted lipoprotein with Yx(FWY)xxD motif
MTLDPTGEKQYAEPGQKDGLRVWAYRGRPVYTYSGDHEPGDMEGHNIRSFVLWGYSMVRADGSGDARF